MSDQPTDTQSNESVPARKKANPWKWLCFLMMLGLAASIALCAALYSTTYRAIIRKWMADDPQIEQVTIEQLENDRLKEIQVVEQIAREEEEKKEAEPALVTPQASQEEAEQEVRYPQVHTASSGGDVKRLSKGFQLKTEVLLEKGDIASRERIKDDSYQAFYQLRVKTPAASKTITELEEVNEHLGKILPDLGKMLETAQVSRFYFDIYENKVERLKKNALQLNELITKHNFFDCETILNLKHPVSGQKVLLLQGDMDVVSDGSDGDRLPTMPDKIVTSSNYQPMTSYGWRKTSKTPNPLIKGWKGRIANASKELADSKTTKARADWLKMRIEKIKREIEDMEARSYLIAEYDPFVVMPINMVVNRDDEYAARVGDYCVVIYGDTLYPAIVGDAGPSFKVGEASLRMAKQLDERANPYRRPVSDLTVTYLVFPRSVEKPNSAPNYDHWRNMCQEFIDSIGGLGEGYQLFEWQNTLPPLPGSEPPASSSAAAPTEGSETSAPAETKAAE